MKTEKGIKMLDESPKTEIRTIECHEHADACVNCARNCRYDPVKKCGIVTETIEIKTVPVNPTSAEISDIFATADRIGSLKMGWECHNPRGRCKVINRICPSECSLYGTICEHLAIEGCTSFRENMDNVERLLSIKDKNVDFEIQ